MASQHYRLHFLFFSDLRDAHDPGVIGIPPVDGFECLPSDVGMETIRTPDNVDGGEQYLAMDPVGIFDESLMLFHTDFALAF